MLKKISLFNGNTDFTDIDELRVPNIKFTEENWYKTEGISKL